LAGTVFPNFSRGAAPIVDFLSASRSHQCNGAKSDCNLIQFNHGVSFSGSKAARLRANKTYAKGAAHQNSVATIVPQRFTPINQKVWVKAQIIPSIA